MSDLVKIFFSLKSEKDMGNFLENILTPGEIEEILRRLKIMSLLQKGFTQREVATKVGVGIATVSRGARVLKYGKPGLNLFFK